MASGPDASDAPPLLAPLGRVPAIVAVALACAFLLLASPYRGLRHDGLLYIAQALSHVDTTWFAKDFFFQYGSQDQFTLFTPALAAVVARLGIGDTALGLLVIGRLLSLVAVWLITSEWPAWRRMLALLAYAGLSHHFGADRMFSLLEPFLTARTFAEPLALLGVAALLRGRLAWALVAITLGVLCHPLMALPVVVAGWIYLVLQDRRWLYAALALAPVGALAVAHVAPFARLLEVYDRAWFEVVMMGNDDIFVGTWGVTDWAMLLGNVVFLLIALRGQSGPLARFSRACLATLALLLAVSWIGADLLHDVLITQLQLWRATWIVHVAFVVWLPGVIIDKWRQGGTARLASAAMFFVASALADSFPNSWALLLWTIGLLALDAFGITLSPRTYWMAFAATVVGGIVTSGLELWSSLYQLRMHMQGTALTHVASLPFVVTVLSVPAFAMLLREGGMEGRRGTLGRVLAVVVLAGAAWQFDQRPAFTRYQETAVPASHPFEALIPPGSQVYWEHLDVAPTWLVLRRPSFVSYAQFSGVLFNRGTAMAGRARWPYMLAVDTREENCRMLEGMTGGGNAYHFADCDTPEDLFFAVCHMKPEHADFAITSENYGRPSIATWRYVSDDGSPAVTYYLHDCRASPATVATAR